MLVCNFRNHLVNFDDTNPLGADTTAKNVTGSSRVTKFQVSVKKTLIYDCMIFFKDKQHI